jgi:hypothetical protein
MNGSFPTALQPAYQILPRSRSLLNNTTKLKNINRVLDLGMKHSICGALAGKP